MDYYLLLIFFTLFFIACIDKEDLLEILTGVTKKCQIIFQRNDSKN